MFLQKGRLKATFKITRFRTLQHPLTLELEIIGNGDSQGVENFSELNNRTVGIKEGGGKIGIIENAKHRLMK